MTVKTLQAVRKLIAAGLTDEQITAVLGAFDSAVVLAHVPTTPAAQPAEQTADRPGAIPSVKYRVRSGVTAARIAELPASLQSIVSLVNSAGALGRREITERLNHATKKVTESAVHSLKVRGILEAMPIGEDVPPVRAAKRSNGVKLGKRK